MPPPTTRRRFLGSLFAATSSLAALKRAEELKADHALVRRLLGRVYYVAGDYANAVRHLEKFLELDPKHAEADQDRELVAYLKKSLK